MATDHSAADFLPDQLYATGSASVRKMSGEYCLYLACKPTAQAKRKS